MRTINMTARMLPCGQRTRQACARLAHAAQKEYVLMARGLLSMLSKERQHGPFSANYARKTRQLLTMLFPIMPRLDIRWQADVDQLLNHDEGSDQ